MNAPERIFLPDDQASADRRQLAIQQVGIKGLRYPINLRSGDVDTSIGNAPHKDQEADIA